MKQSELGENTPQYNGLGKSIYKRLPNLLKDICKPITVNHEKDLVLLASLVLLSNIIRVNGIYDNRKVFPNLFLFITAKASSGKGVLKWVKMLAAKIHKNLELDYKIKMAIYNKLEDKTDAEKPLKETFFIPGNASLTAMVRQLSNNKGFGVIVESEADTLNVAMKNDWGNYSEVLRKAYEFETISQLRKDEDNSFEIDNPRLSIVITGTQNQLLDFIPSVENGLFSRFMFMEFPLLKTWKNVFKNKVDFYSHYESLANTLSEIYNKNNHISVSLSSAHEDIFHQKFTTYHNQYDALLGEDVISSIRRIGNMHFRICMLLTGIRQLENNSKTETKAVCSDDDFEIANELIIYLLDNLKSIYGYLPIVKKITKNLNRKQALLYENLSEEFTFNEFTTLAEDLGIAFSTSENYLRAFKKSGLIEKLEHGKYSKIKL